MAYTDDEIKALALLKSGVNAFLTGGAGVGKSFVINEYRDYVQSTGKNIIVCAPTGIAAGNVYGVTIHKVFKLMPIVQIEKSRQYVKNNDDSADDILYKTDVLIIDEISMCRVDVFDIVALRILKANERRRNSGLKTIQLIVVGDFFQLPPVITDVDRITLEYDRDCDIGLGFAYQSKFWDMFKFCNIVLNEVVRQDNKEFVEMLNSIRVGNKYSLDTLYNNSNPNIDDSAVNLCGLNSEADRINYQKLAELPGSEVRYDAVYDGEATENDCIAPRFLRLKVGARVMTIANVEDDCGSFVNGDFGIVTGLYSDGITVRLDSGHDIAIKRHTWKVYNYIIDETNKYKVTCEVCGSVEQFPLRLAYAVTIHKSQGQTYDKANINPSCWECGQLYVALSRVRSLRGLYLHKQPEYSDSHCSLSVIKFYNELYKNINNNVNIPNNTQNTEKEQSVMDNAEDLLSVIRKW